MADAHSDSDAYLISTPPGYPPHGEILRIPAEGATSLSAHTGRT
ncbi:hypothetical protein [Methylobacterium fujisawaense]|jgi:hypothetical protein